MKEYEYDEHLKIRKKDNVTAWTEVPLGRYNHVLSTLLT